MHYRVYWDTTYAYGLPANLLHTELRLLPAESGGQLLINGSITLDPPARLFALTDAWGNRYHHADYAHPIDQLTVSMAAEVRTIDFPVEEPAIPPLLFHMLSEFTTRAPDDPRIRALAAGFDPTDPLGLALGISQLIGKRCVFETGQTDVSSTALDLLDQGRGVCQDFSHLLLAAVRSRGLAARYVSGYLGPAEGEDVGEASHAWVQVWHDGLWQGIDPANQCRQDGRYIVTAVGRDYDDVPPVRGGFRGGIEHDWTTSVRVLAQEQ